MPHLHTPAGALHLVQLFVAIFLAILFLQSGLDKIIDRAGNYAWLKGHFAKSLLASFVPLLLVAITVLELAAGALSGVGAVLILFRRDSVIAFYGAVLAAISIIALFFGQRMAKEYPGAASLVPYFLLTLAGVYLLAVA